MKEIELINKRKLREKHFLQEDGTIVAKIYNTDIHYKKNDKYEEIDNTLINENGYFCNKKNKFKTLFSEEVNDTIMRMEQDNYFIEFELENINEKTKATHKNKTSKFVENIMYKDIMENIDIKYIVLPNKVKETIILKQKNKNKIKFNINTNLSLKEINNHIEAKYDNKKIFEIEKPYMEDANGKVNTNIHYNLKKNNSKYELELILDNKWLNDKETLYPIYI